MASELIQQVEEAGARLFRRGEGIIAGVSGGVDSMVMLHALHRLSQKYEWRVGIAHLNHQLRGRSSDADQKLVERTARELGLPVITERADIRAMRAHAKGSMEMVARHVRHEFLARAAKEKGMRTIALAHHADDQVELFFLRLFRGAGADGLSGMQALAASPVDAELNIARPLLGVTRAEIEEYARSERIPFREDASNLSIDHARNRVRHKLLPLLERDFQPAIREVILRTIELLEPEAEFSEQAAMDWLANPKADFEKLHMAVQRRVLQLQLIQEEIAPDFELIEWLRESVDKPCTVSVGKEVHRDRQGRVIASKPGWPQFTGEAVELDLSNEVRRVIFDTVEISWRLKPVKGTPRIVKRTRSEMFDADVIGDRIVLRHWRPGDRLQPIGMKSRVKLQDLFGNAKIAKAERHQRLIATTASGEIFWVEGLRISEHFKVRVETRRVLEWKWKR